MDSFDFLLENSSVYRDEAFFLTSEPNMMIDLERKDKPTLLSQSNPASLPPMAEPMRPDFAPSLPPLDFSGFPEVAIQAPSLRVEPMPQPSFAPFSKPIMAKPSIATPMTELPKLKSFNPAQMVCIPEPDMPLQTIASHAINRPDMPIDNPSTDAVGFIPLNITRLAPLSTSRRLLVPKSSLTESDQFYISVPVPTKPAVKTEAAVKPAPSGFVQTQRIAPQFSRMDRAAFDAHQDEAYLNRPEGKVGKDGRRRLVWTPELHQRFVTAVRVLGIKSSVPKNVLQLMNVEGITRENVASRLQKFRLFVRRSADIPDSQALEDSHLTEVIELNALNSSKLCV
ncbi:Myb-like DNA-binding domain [Carpediemonas membranifera]|uniref:Myb-like DNA-binding domain n=1 Tax=Carpediemonas membranifera TaxID=201153 RepID=A0A8J6BBK4_9EUKA|nr:Myb-like DNA-binding domain [Carpediemonas membranifera]|eukprot:KAG9396857.1 Myb-like DNA-binding domain [Carpediemonas membranifera]